VFCHIGPRYLLGQDLILQCNSIHLGVYLHDRKVIVVLMASCCGYEYCWHDFQIYHLNLRLYETHEWRCIIIIDSCAFHMVCHSHGRVGCTGSPVESWRRMAAGCQLSRRQPETNFSLARFLAQFQSVPTGEGRQNLHPSHVGYRTWYSTSRKIGWRF